MRTVHQRVFVTACLCLLVAPFALMPFAHEDASAEKRELAPMPQLVKDGAWNPAFMSEAGEYFADHFAFRSMLVDVDASIKQAAFGTSSTENVVVGRDGWLYYAGTLNDYRRRGALSDQALENVAHNVALMQEHFQAGGKRFAFAVAPNKNTLYPAHMPYYELEGEGPSNLDRLVPLLAERGVNYVDLRAAFDAHPEELYFARDSHWNERGARLAYGCIMEGLGRRPWAFENETSTDAHEGDVDGMLHPVFAQPELQPHDETLDRYEMANEATSVEDSYIITSSQVPEAEGTLIMYRDSFGNNLLHPFATTYSQAVFTKLVPYDMGEQMTAFAQDVVVERAERHLDFFATDPPYLPAPERDVAVVGESESGSGTIFMDDNGPYLVVEGTRDMSDEHAGGTPYVRVTLADGQQRTFEAFRVSQPREATSDFEGEGTAGDARITGDGGYRAYLPVSRADMAEGGVELLCGTTDAAFVVSRL